MLIRSISGVRGLTDTHLTPQSSIAYAKALHQFLPDGVIMAGGGEIVVHPGKILSTP